MGQVLTEAEDSQSLPVQSIAPILAQTVGSDEPQNPQEVADFDSLTQNQTGEEVVAATVDLSVPGCSSWGTAVPSVTVSTQQLQVL